MNSDAAVHQHAPLKGAAQRDWRMHFLHNAMGLSNVAGAMQTLVIGTLLIVAVLVSHTYEVWAGQGPRRPDGLAAKAGVSKEPTMINDPGGIT